MAVPRQDALGLALSLGHTRCADPPMLAPLQLFNLGGNAQASIAGDAATVWPAGENFEPDDRSSLMNFGPRQVGSSVPSSTVAVSWTAVAAEGAFAPVVLAFRPQSGARASGAPKAGGIRTDYRHAAPAPRSDGPVTGREHRPPSLPPGPRGPGALIGSKQSRTAYERTKGGHA